MPKPNVIPESETVMCCHCGVRIPKSDNAGSDKFTLCRRCFDDSYTKCVCCGTVLVQEFAYHEGNKPYCLNCYRDLGDDRVIKSHDYKPRPIFYGEGTRYFGIELEVDCGNAGDCKPDSLEEDAGAILRSGNCGGEHIYCKHDGSLEVGFEIVSHPMTLNYHMNSMPWAFMLGELRYSMNYLSHQADCCGLHVHVNRNSFGDDVADQEACISRVLYFFEKHWNELLKFSRRTARQLDRWAARYGYKDHPKEMLEHCKKGSSGRYSCVNLLNPDTIEFRIFRGTLRYNTFIATLQLVDRICEMATSMTDEKLRAMSWSTFVSGCTQPELVRYLKEHRLYVNDPVEAEEEI